MKYIVRTNCEYSIVIEADSAEEAMKKAAPIKLEDWEQSWAQWEADKDSGGE